MSQILQNAIAHPNQFVDAIPGGAVGIGSNSLQGMQMSTNFMHQNMPASQVMTAPTSTLPPPGMIPLTTLIDFVVHKTYHDITVMAEVLPSKTDMEKKIAIVQFATRTRQLFIRLLSLVKWATSVGKVGICSEISSFLDRQAMLFVDTADKLHILSNQVVVQARLPNFSVPAAVDVLTTGTYPRLPNCIRDKIVPQDPILPKAKKATLKRIEQIILFRLVTEVIPLQIADLKVEKGVVHLYVPGEFKAAVTLMGDGPDIPWRLLKLEFLVEDREVGSGKSLVHNLQVNYLHELVQSRLFANDKPLVDLFRLLHFFCLSLKLEVLQAQADRLARLRWGMFIQVDEYLPGQKLSLSYWRINPYKKQVKPRSIAIRQSPNDGSKPLQVVHTPSLPLDDIELVESASHIKHLSLEKLLNQTICIRSYHLLSELKQVLQKHIRADPSFFAKEANGQSSVLFIPLVEPWKSKDCLSIYVDPQTGMFVPSLNSAEDSQIEKMEKEINENVVTLLSWITTLRNLEAKKRCIKSISHLPVVCLERLPLVNEQSHPIGQIGGNRLYVKVNRYPAYFLVISIESCPTIPTKILYKYYLLKTSSDSANSNAFEMKKADDSLTRVDLHAVNFVELNSSLTDVAFLLSPTKRSRKDDNSVVEDANAKELIHVTSVWLSRIPFVSLLESLNEVGIEHQGLQEEGADVGMVCKLVRIPEVKGVSTEVNALLQDAVLQCSFRFQERSNKFWSVELVMKDPPMKALLPRHESSSLKVSFHYEVTSHANSSLGDSDPVRAFLNDWEAIARLYGPFYLYSKQLQHPACDLASRTSLHFFNYKSIVIKYGSSLLLFVNITWSPEKKFQLHFGRSDTSPSANGHCLTRHYLNEMLNINPDISKLMHVLTDTSRPLQALARLPTTPLIGVSPKLSLCDGVFSVVAQGPTHMRVSFMSVYFIDVYCHSNETVALRDASFSQFEFANIKSNTVPVPGLATFLAHFRDEKDIRHRSDEEKDNPPSPSLMQSNQSGPTTHGLQELAHSPWAGANLILLSHANVNILCTPITVRRNHSQAFTPCPLEQFLGATLVRRHMEKCIRSTANITAISVSNAEGADGSLASAFAAGTLQFLCRLHPVHSRQLLLKIHPVPMTQPMESWSSEDLQVLEKYFELRVACSPYRFNVMKSFFTMISAQASVLRDFIQLMRMELAGSRAGPNVKWTVNICLTSPPRISIAPCGMPSVLIKEKILLFIQLTQIPSNQPATAHTTLVIPLLLEPPRTSVNVLSQALSPNSPTHQLLHHVSTLLGRMPMDVRENPYSTAARFLIENLILQ